MPNLRLILMRPIPYLQPSVWTPFIFNLSKKYVSSGISRIVGNVRHFFAEKISAIYLAPLSLNPLGDPRQQLRTQLDI
jgi:hypothetical protein